MHIKLARKGSLLSVRMDHVSKTSIKRLQLVSNFLKDILATKQGVWISYRALGVNLWILAKKQVKLENGVVWIIDKGTAILGLYN